jgi:very-short-patch-repair endonuclease
MAAVLACGPGAVLSYQSAAALWGIRPSARSLVDVTVHRRLRQRAWIELHQDELQRDEMTNRDFVPVTSIARTLLDLAAVLGRRELERTVNEAEALRIFDGEELKELLLRHPRHGGGPVLAEILDAGFSGVTKSELEDLFRQFLADESFPAAELNVPIQCGGVWVEADCAWRKQRLIVELDGHRTHGTRAAFERDRRRDRALQAQGWRVIRVTWRQLHEESRELAADLRALLCV